MFILERWYSSRPPAGARSSIMERHCLELNLTQSQWLRVVMTLGVDTPESQAIITLLKSVRKACEKKQDRKGQTALSAS